MQEPLEVISRALVDCNQTLLCEEVSRALDGGTSPEAILQEALVPGMRQVGTLFEEGEFFLPEMLVAARAMKAALVILEPLLADSDIQPVGRVVAGTVEGDLHDIGKNLVCTMLGGVGFEIHDLGADVKIQAFVEGVREHQANVVVMSALLTTTMVNMKATIDALEEAGLREGVTVMVGGAPLSKAYAEEIGADGFAPDASRAAKLATKLVSA
jgi:5-methyltetrahydrofolate--homocysteine methyltransferase